MQAASPGILHSTASHTEQTLTFAAFDEHLTEYYPPELKAFILEESTNDLTFALIDALNADPIETPATLENMNYSMVTILCALKLIDAARAKQFTLDFYRDKNLNRLVTNLKETHAATFSSLINTEGEKARIEGIHGDPVQQFQYLCQHLERFTPISYIMICNAFALSQYQLQVPLVLAGTIFTNALESLRQERATIASTLASRIKLLVISAAVATLASTFLF
jgi:hypothetical protein